MGTFYRDKDEYRWERLPVGQGYYFLADIEAEAIRLAGAHVKSSDDVIVLQRWKPRGRKLILVTRASDFGSRKEIVETYVAQGYDKRKLEEALKGGMLYEVQ